MFELKMFFATPAELADFVNRITPDPRQPSLDLTQKVSDSQINVVVAPSPGEAAAAVVEAGEKKKPGRPKKDKEPVVTEPEKESVKEQDPPASTPRYTAEKALAALQALNSAKGIDAARAVLASFKAARISEITADDYHPFIDACEKAAA